jgi:predicted nucleic acid-binding protein
MVLLDTNILSAMMRVTPVREVADWMRYQPSETLFTAAVCQAEILAGIASLPHGRRRADLEDAARGMFAEDFRGRVLPFDDDAATAYATLFAAGRNAGRPVGTIDCMLASIARVRGAPIITRNVTDFGGMGLTIINPWDVQTGLK